jgi:hypothetical protein
MWPVIGALAALVVPLPSPRDRQEANPPSKVPHFSSAKIEHITRLTARDHDSHVPKKGSNPISYILKQVAYSEFLKALDSGQISEVYALKHTQTQKAFTQKCSSRTNEKNTQYIAHIRQ